MDEGRMQRPGFVYFILCRQAKRVKIGWSDLFPDERLAACRTGSPYRLERWRLLKTVFATEGELHARFRRERREGEWFYLSKRLREYVEAETVSWEEPVKVGDMVPTPEEIAAYEKEMEELRMAAREFEDHESTCYMLGEDPRVDYEVGASSAFPYPTPKLKQPKRAVSRRLRYGPLRAMVRDAAKIELPPRSYPLLDAAREETAP